MSFDAVGSFWFFIYLPCGRSAEHFQPFFTFLWDGSDVFLKLKPLDCHAIYISERTNLATAVLPPIITNLQPIRIMYTCKDVSIELSDDCWIEWNRDRTNTNVWKMTVSVHGKERTVYEEPSTKYCLAAFGLYDEAGNFVTTNRVLHRSGLEYAWKLTIYSREDQVRIKDIVKLPDRGVWSDTMSVPEGLTVVTNHISPDERESLPSHRNVKNGWKCSADLPHGR